MLYYRISMISELARRDSVHASSSRPMTRFDEVECLAVCRANREICCSKRSKAASTQNPACAIRASSRTSHSEYRTTDSSRQNLRCRYCCIVEATNGTTRLPGDREVEANPSIVRYAMCIQFCSDLTNQSKGQPVGDRPRDSVSCYQNGC